MNTPIILIGPMATGKSTIAGLLADRLKIPQVAMDLVRWYYYYKDGYSLEKDRACPDFPERLKYWKPFEVKAVRRIIEEFPNSIIDFGAGHSFYVDENQFQEVAETLRTLPNIFFAALT